MFGTLARPGSTVVFADFGARTDLVAVPHRNGAAPISPLSADLVAYLAQNPVGGDSGVRAEVLRSDIELAESVRREALTASRADAAREAIRRAEKPDAGRRADVRPPLKLSDEQLNIAQFVANRYRVALDEVQHVVAHAYDAASEVRIDPYLVLAIVAIESSFDPKARSSKGAQGLMQVLTRLHREKFAPFGGVASAFDPVANLRVGSRILKEYLIREGSVEGALKSYVGAALMKHDFGYGKKVLSERERIVSAAGADAQARISAAGAGSANEGSAAGAAAAATKEGGRKPVASARQRALPTARHAELEAAENGFVKVAANRFDGNEAAIRLLTSPAAAYSY